MTVDMNKIRAARREALGEGPEVIIGEAAFRGVPDLPFDAIVAAGRAQNDNDAEAVFTFVRECVGPDGVKALRDWKPSLYEMQELVSGIMDEYGRGGERNGDGSEEATAGEAGT